jgi:anaerobic ribonucleoside-triphosphate reductase activating protein
VELRVLGVTIRVAAFEHGVQVLGPGRRTVVWVQGCPFRCPGCIAPEWIPEEGGTPWDEASLADALLADPHADGITLSGGDPFAQAGPLAEVVRLVRARRDLSVMSYTGFTLEQLERDADPDRLALLAELDLLVDGTYVAARHTPLRWRGSTNQRIHALTDRHLDLEGTADVPAGMQLKVHAGSVRIVGVPSRPGFRPSADAALRALPDDDVSPSDDLTGEEP